MGSEIQCPTMIIFPHMAQGHALPLLDLAKLLSHRGINVIIITTPANSIQISSSISKFSNISTHIIPFPTSDDLPQGCENTKDLASFDQILPFLRATRKLNEPFESFLRSIVNTKSHPVCVICDFFLGWSVPICNSFNIPAILFYGMGVLPTAISHITFMHAEYIKGLSSDETVKTLPGLVSPFSLSRDDFPHLIEDNHPVMRYISESGDDGASACLGILANSFEGLEGDYIGTLESTYKNTQVWCVGPLFLYDQTLVNANLEASSKHHLCEEWLDEQGREDSVIYVAFGTQAHMSSVQMDEIAIGLEMAGHPFIWNIGSSNWEAPKGWEEKVEGKGLIVREWIDQRRLLAHRAVGGFLSHCGWNSVLESLSMGVPLLTWAMGADQPINAKFVTQVMKAGMPLKNISQVKGENNVNFERNAICNNVRVLMSGDAGKLARNRAKEIGKMARKAVENDGTSSKMLDQLIKSVCDMGKKMLI